MRFVEDEYAYDVRPARDGSCTFVRRKFNILGKLGKKTKTVTIPAHVMEGNDPEDVLRDVVDEGGFDY